MHSGILPTPLRRYSRTKSSIQSVVIKSHGLKKQSILKIGADFKGRIGLSVPGLILVAMAMVLFLTSLALAQFNQPWREKKHAIILDAYELNSIDWMKIIKNKRVAGFISKASDGLSPKYCANRKELCGAKWRKYSVTKELYHTRRMLAKHLGLKWGSYHLGRAGNPIQQALHYLKFARPSADEVIVLDIEGLNDERYMKLEDAEKFSRFLKKKIGRFPMLYTNHQTASHIAQNRTKYPILSRLKLWYARYKLNIGGVFPLGNWDKHTLWQFAYGGNCKKGNCPYRVQGTPYNIDVNVSPLNVAALRAAWPFDGLHPDKPAPSSHNNVLLAKTVQNLEDKKQEQLPLNSGDNGTKIGRYGKNALPVLRLLNPKKALAARDQIFSSAASGRGLKNAARFQKPPTNNITCSKLEIENMDSDDLDAC